MELKLRWLGIALSIAISVGGIGVATALIIISDFLNEAVEALELSVESVYLAEELESKRPIKQVQEALTV